jgi:hypothetical protein
MTKTEAKPAFHQMFGDWQRERGIVIPSKEIVSFSEFLQWANERGYSHYFNFGSVMGADEDVELWFDRFFKQSWRN